MEQQIDTRVLLEAAQVIRENGKRKEDESYVYHQIRLVSSHDGYTISLSDSKVSITVLFHNRLQIDYQKMADLEDFYHRVKRVGDNRYAAS